MTTTSVATLRAGDVIIHQSGAMLLIKDKPQPGNLGTLVKVAHHKMTGHDLDRGYQQWYTDRPFGPRLNRGDVVDTPLGIGTVVGFIRELGRVLVQRDGVNGADAVKATEVFVP